MEHLLGNTEGGGTEEHPASGNHVESNHSAEHDYKPVSSRIGVALTWQIGERTQERTQKR